MTSLFGDLLVGVGVAAILAILGWVAGPLKWPFQSRTIRGIILKDRNFHFFYEPVVNQKKTVTFLKNGEIGKGKNNNEHRWRIKRGRLEILAVDGKVYSRFRHDPSTGRLVHTNDPDTRSVHGQYFVPQWETPDYDRH